MTSALAFDLQVATPYITSSPATLSQCEAFQVLVWLVGMPMPDYLRELPHVARDVPDAVDGDGGGASLPRGFGKLCLPGALAGLGLDVGASPLSAPSDSKPAGGRSRPQGSVAAYLDEDTSAAVGDEDIKKQPKEQFDFFPLTVDVEERTYAAGKIPGSFFRREGRPRPGHPRLPPDRPAAAPVVR